MGTSLTGVNISASYLGLLKSTDSLAISTTAKTITDGAGNDLPIKLSTNQMLFGTGTESVPALSFNANTSEGFYIPTDENIGVTIAGSEVARFNGTGLSLTSSKLTLSNDQKIRWTSDDVYIQGTTSADNIQIGVGGSTQFTFAQTTGMRLHQYGSGSITGTVTQRLGVTSTGQVVEIPIGSGAVDGNGTAGKIVKWSDTDTIVNSIITESSNLIQIGHIGSGTLNEASGVKLAIIGNLGDNTDGLIITRGGSGQGQLDQFLNIYYDGASNFLTSGGTSTHGSFDFRSTNDEGNTSTSRLSIDSSGNSTFQGNLNIVDTKKIIFGGTASSGADSASITFNDSTGILNVTASSSDSHKVQICGDTIEAEEGGTATFANGATVQSALSVDSIQTIGSGTTMSLGTSAGNVMTLLNSNLGVNVTSPTTAKLVVAGDVNTFTLRVDGYDTTNQSFGARIRAGTSSSDTALLVENTSASELFKVAGDGNASFGGTLASGNVTVTGGSGGNGQVDILRTSGATLFHQAQASVGVVGTSTNHRLDLKTNSTTALTINTSQQVGINTTSPSNLLEIDGGTGVATTGTLVLRQNGDTASSGLSITSSHATSHRIWKDASGNLNIGSSADPDAFKQDTSGNATFAGDVTATSKKFISTSSSSGDYVRLYAGSGTGKWDIYGSGADLRFSDNDSAGAIRFDTNVGIGASPSEDLHITGDTPVIRLTDSDTSRDAQIVAIDGNLRFDADNNDAQSSTHIAFRTDGGEAMRIDASRRLGLGTTSPDELFQVEGASGLDGATPPTIKINSSSAGNWTDNAVFAKLAFGNEDTAGGIACAINAFVDSTTGNNAGLSFSTSASANTPLERVRIDKDGNVGIGLNNPSAYGKFIVKDSSSSLINLDCTSGSAKLTFFENGTGRFGFHTLNGSDGLAFVDGDGSSERLRIDSSGNVGIATTSPNHLLDVESVGASMRLYNTTSNGNTEFFITTAGTTGASKIMFGDTDDADIGKIIYRHNGNSMAFETNDSESMRIDSNGTLLVGTTSAQSGTKFQVNGVSYFQGVNTTNGTAVFVPDSNKGTAQSHIHYGTTGDWYIRPASNSGKVVIADNAGMLVGIGTASPSVPLTVNNTTDNSDIAIFHAGGGTPNRGLKISTFANVDDNAGVEFDAQFSNGAFKFSSNGTERLSISSTGLTTIKRTGITGVTKNDMTLHIGFEGNNGQNNLIGFGYNGVNAIPAYIGFTTTSGSTNTKGDLIFATRSVVTDSDPTERLRIDSNGNVGVGTTSPSSKLTLSDTSSNSIVQARFINDARDYAIGVHGGLSDSFVLYDDTADETRLVVDTSGKIGVGTTSPLAKLHTSDNDGGTIYIEDANATSTYSITSFTNGAGNFSLDTRTSAGSFVATEYQISKNASGADYHRWFTQGTEKVRLDSSGNLAVGTTSPDGQLHVKGTKNKTLKLDPTFSTGTFTTLAFARNGTDKWRVFHISDDSYLSFFNENTSAHQLSLASDGNVGISTTSPSQKLHVSGGHLRLDDTYKIEWGGSNARIDGSNASDFLRFFTSDSERLRVDSSGVTHIMGASASTNNSLQLGYNSTAGSAEISAKSTSGTTHFEFSTSNSGTTSEKVRFTGVGTVGINQTSPDGRLHITFNDASGGTINVGARIEAERTNSSSCIAFKNPNGTVGTIQTLDSATSYNTSSDYRLKEDLQDFNALEIASKIKMYDFKWKADDSRSYGVMAHELQEVVPQAVSGDKDAEDMQQVDYSKLVPILLKSIQELEARVKELEKEI